MVELKTVHKPEPGGTGGEVGTVVPKRGREATPASKNAALPAARVGRPFVVGRSDRPRMPNGLETVIGTDERTRILDTEQPPFSMICALDIDGPWGRFVGTGWFAGPKTLITAGHCVFDRTQMGGWARSIEVTPGRDGDEKPFASVTATKFSSLDRWIEAADADFDIGAIHLDQPLGDQVGWFGVASLPDEELKDFLVNVSGYPGDRGGTQQWWAMNRVRAVSPRRIFYDVDTTGGQSGAPVYVFENASAPPLVVGIHAYGTGGTPSGIAMEVNSAPRMIPEVVDQVRRWIEEGPKPAA